MHIPPSLYARAGWLSRALVLWLSPLLALGYRRPLEPSDLPALASGYRAAHVRDRLRTAWETRRSQGGTGSYRLLWACFDAFGGPFMWAGVLKLIGDCCALTSPILLSTVIQSLRRGEAINVTQGILLCLAIFFLQQINTLTVNAYFTITMQTGMRVRASASALVYAKALRLSGRARQTFSTGQIVNLMSTDGGRIDMAACYLHYLWSGPFQVLVILVLLFRLLQWAAFVGLAILCLAIPIQSKITALLSKYRKQTSSITDRRVRLMQEIIQGIRVIKLYAWEGSFLGKLFGLREAELGRVSKTQVVRSLMIVMTSFTSIYSCILSFVTYHWMGYELTAEVVFPTLVLFNLLRLPLILLPMVASMSVDGSVAIRRLQKFLLADELDFCPITREGTTEWGVEVRDGTFIWEVTSPEKTMGQDSKDTFLSPLSAVTATATAIKAEGLMTKVVEATSATNLLMSPPSPPTSDTRSSVATDRAGGADADVDAAEAEAVPGSKVRDTPTHQAAVEAINIRIRQGHLAAIVGPVGSGKSSLLAALIGELKCARGEVIFGGTVAYCPQQAWIQNATVQENILFGSPLDEARYEAVLEACALKPDLAMLPDGDGTEIGEKGVNLSGGQKQRISLARAAYSHAQIVLLDDPLSAVDAHVGRHLLEHCLGELMRGRTRLLVTHQLYTLPKVDHVILMEAGRIIEQGPYEQLMGNGNDFARLMNTYGGGNGSVHSRTPSSADDDADGARGPLEKPPVESQRGSGENPVEATGTDKLNPALNGMIRTTAKAPLHTQSQSQPPSNPAVTKEASRDPIKGQKTTASEERVTGAVQWSVYRDYGLAAGGLAFGLLGIGSIVAWNITRILTDYWIAMRTSADPWLNVTPGIFQLVYLGLGLVQGVFAAASGLAFAWGGVRAARQLHNRAAQRALHAPVSYFDTNPTGRIINRFSKDQDTLDNLVPESLRSFSHTFGLTAFTYVTMVLFNFYFVFPLLGLLALYYGVQRYYRMTSRELKRIEALTRSPLFAQFGETLTGLPTVRAFGQQARFIRRNELLMDSTNRASFVQTALQRWLGIRLESVGNLIILTAAVCCYLFRLPPALTGLTISYALSVTSTMNWCIRQFTDLETQIISSERLGHYANHLPQERVIAETAASSVAASSWPLDGSIEMRNLCMRYRPDLPPVLTGVTLKIHTGERIGIVGRTGAGKSSILQALFRMTEADAGSIIISGLDISTLSLAQLRRAISIIPQDPVIFAGSVRWNLDPAEEHTDQQLWTALERAHLRDSIMALGEGLNSTIQEGGENLSVGQRQLLCLARALLRRNRILVLDEATANIDLATDALIQRAIRTDFGGCTILTIAHRISTVVDYDRILVLEQGRVVEFDTPRALLACPEGHFAALVREAQ